MAKVTYTSLKLKTNTDVKTFDFNGKTIEVLQYLPAKDKYDLINIVLQEAEEGKIYSPFKIDMLFHLYLVYLYSNITFTDKQKEDQDKLYNELDSCGLIDKIIENIPDNEYTRLWDYLQESVDLSIQYNTTAAAMLDSIIDNLPRNAQLASDIMNEINKTDISSVIDFAKSINNGKLSE